MDDLPLGAHLTSPRRGFLHHGIYAGNGQVIQYSGFERSLRRGPIEVVALADFTLGRGLAVVNSASARFIGGACLARALSRVGENRYRIFSNNCEHFARWCTSGTSRSLQVEALQAKLRHAMLRAIRAWRQIAAAAAPKLTLPVLTPRSSAR